MTFVVHNTHDIEEWRPGVSSRMQISALTGATALTIFEQWCAPGLGAPIHWHPVEEVLTVLSGEAEIFVDGKYHLAKAGHSALVPAESRHGFRNTGKGELHMLAILAAPFFEARYDDDQQVSLRWKPDGEK